jgi:hypothetical protein
VRFGLTMCIIGGWIGLGTMGVWIAGAILCGLIAWGGAWVTSGAIFWVVIVICALGGFASMACWLTGQGLCLQAPSERDYPTWALALSAFICSAAPLALGGIMSAAAFNGVLFVNGGVNAFVSFAAMVLWCLFLRAACLSMRDSVVAGKCMTWMIAALIAGGVSVVLIAIAIALMIMGGVGGGQVGFQLSYIFAIVVGLLCFAAAISIVIWHLLILKEVQGVINRHVSKKTDD